MKVLHVLPSLTLASGGPPVVAVNIARALEAASIETALYATTAFHRDRHSTKIDDPPIGLSDLEAQVFPLGMLSRLALSRKLGAVLKESASDFDLIHIHMLFQYPQFAAFRIAKRHDLPYVVTPHGALDPFLRSRGRLRKWAVDRVFQRRMLDEASAIHYTSYEERSLVEDLAFKAPAVVIPNGVDVVSAGRRPEESEINAMRREMRIGPGPLIVNHGRLDPKKGLPILIHAFDRVRVEIPGAQLVLVGPDSRGHKAELVRLIEELGLTSAVKFAGLRNGTELLSLIHAADVWALPSHSENFGYAVVEALAAAIPVVTSPHVNIAPDAAEAEALMMVENEPDVLADALLTLLADKAVRQDLGLRGRAYAQQFDWSKVGEQYVNLYLEVVRRHQDTKFNG